MNPLAAQIRRNLAAVEIAIARIPDFDFGSRDRGIWIEEIDAILVARPLGAARNSRAHDGLTIGVKGGQRFQGLDGFWRQNFGINGFKIGTDLQLSRSHKLPPCNFTRHERRTGGALG